MSHDQSQLGARTDQAVAAFEGARNPIAKSAARRDLEKLRVEAKAISSEQAALAAIKSAPRGDIWSVPTLSPGDNAAATIRDLRDVTQAGDVAAALQAIRSAPALTLSANLNSPRKV